jgi:hypothetical protein
MKFSHEIIGPKDDEGYRRIKFLYSSESEYRNIDFGVTFEIPVLCTDNETIEDLLTKAKQAARLICVSISNELTD